LVTAWRLPPRRPFFMAFGHRARSIPRGAPGWPALAVNLALQAASRATRACGSGLSPTSRFAATQTLGAARSRAAAGGRRVRSGLGAQRPLGWWRRSPGGDRRPPPNRGVRAGWGRDERLAAPPRFCSHGLQDAVVGLRVSDFDEFLSGEALLLEVFLEFGAGAFAFEFA